MKKFVLDYRSIYKAYAKIVRQKAVKCSLKITEVLLDAEGLSDVQSEIHLVQRNICSPGLSVLS